LLFVNIYFIFIEVLLTVLERQFNTIYY